MTHNLGYAVQVVILEARHAMVSACFSQADLPVSLKDLLIDGLYALRGGQD